MRDENTYPGREPFFSHRFTRLLAKCCVANEIGAAATLMLTFIVQTEDASHYRRGVTYFDGQLMPLLGLNSKSTMYRIRKRAIDAGWLHFVPGHKGKASTYWVMIPERAINIDDAPTDEGYSPDSVSPVNPNRGRNGVEIGTECGALLPIPNPKTVQIGDDGIERPANPFEKPPPASPDALSRFPEPVREQARRMLTEWHFWRYGRLPNLTSDATESNLNTMAGVSEAFGENAETKLKEFMARPPPEFPRSSPLFKIFRYLGLEAPSDDHRRTQQRPSHASPGRRAPPGGGSAGEVERYTSGNRVKTLRFDDGHSGNQDAAGETKPALPPGKSA